jgi:hypothetical protein
MGLRLLRRRVDRQLLELKGTAGRDNAPFDAQGKQTQRTLRFRREKEEELCAVPGSRVLDCELE